jgi:flagellar biosynthesis GTPase FlhF
MSTLQQANTGEGTGKKFRLIVRSAEEAVRVIRDKLGDNAKVISVRQVGGEGLKRFISSPKLEVIAQVVEENEEVSEVTDQINTEPSINPTSPQDHPKEKVVTDEPSPKNEKVEVKGADENGNDNYKLLSKFGFDYSSSFRYPILG